jgi:hydroxymethylpyrimidine pyrophosphatase-like HAD family hydrolase
VIEKAAAVIIRGGLLLLCRKRGTDIFISPGGKREAGEADREALARELLEETGLILRSAELYGRYTAQSALEPDQEMVVTTYVVEADGMARPSGEIEELAWVDAGFAQDGMSVGSVFRDQVIPRLVAEGRIRRRERRERAVGRARERVVIADLDGTLAFPGAGVGPRVKAALSDLAADRDVRLFIATSRAPRGVRALLGPITDELDLLCCNGSLHMQHGEVKSRSPLPSADAARLVGALTPVGADFWLDYGDRFAVSRPEAAPWMDYSDREVIGEGVTPSFEGVVKLSIVDWPRWREAIEMALGPGSIACVHEEGVMDITAAEASKEKALIRCVGERSAVVVAFGNDLNDQLLLAGADRSFLVGSGIPGLHKAGHVVRIEADDETVSNALRAQLSAHEPASC